MKDIRKYMTSLAAAGVVMAAAVPGHAAFTSKGTSTVSASATIGGTPTIAIVSVAIKNIVGQWHRRDDRLDGCSGRRRMESG